MPSWRYAIVTFLFAFHWQRTKIIKISTHSTYHGYGKNKKNALQVSTFLLVLHAKPLVKAIGRVVIWRLVCMKI